MFSDADLSNIYRRINHLISDDQHHPLSVKTSCGRTVATTILKNPHLSTQKKVGSPLAPKKGWEV